METKNYGLLKPEQDDFYDVGVFNTNMDKIDDELKKRSTAMENVSDSEAEFATAEVRETIKSGETLRIILGKIARFFADLKKVAFTGSYNDLSDIPSIGNAAAYGVANNDTTTEAGFVADARIVKTHGDEIDKINSNLYEYLTADGLKFNFSTDGEGNYGFLGADGSLIPFRKGLSGDVITYTGSSSKFSVAFSKDIKAICISGTIESSTNISGQKVTAVAVAESGTLYNNNVTSDIRYVTSGLKYYNSGNILFMFENPPANDGICEVTLDRYLYGATISCLY